MDASPPLTKRRPNVKLCAAMAVAAMLSVQTGAAVSTWMFGSLGPVGAAFSRLALAALILLLFVRPDFRSISWEALLSAAGLGVVSAAMTLCYFQAIDRIPLGTASTLEYLGPFAVAVFGLRRSYDVIWPVLALLGVVLLTSPWSGSLDLAGIGFGLAAGASLAGYVLLSQRVGDGFSGLQGLAVSLAVAAVVSGFFGVGDVVAGFSVPVLLTSVLAALLLPLLPYALEMQALRGMRASSFATLMSFEPGFACIIGFLLLGQHLALLQIAGIALVVIAGIGAVRRGER
ncbi:EamA family transporter [Saccharopolyspora gloriosae]|uniref:Inner membrane transporter RhtA n=1 Tax=Saccharopolyspora gloriosae TaxID=455344 RepID=A0A840NEY8_9PSEU|nr:EamA family transporter [Saccharopolyspora gloriosae]MBB5070946.1 inner membrane transporter RhtA [Saccharopolyspora gloriosae]